ncbi:MAG: RpiB/LacA/LacB family sugar-phosphate isomerase, partial [Parcubacteria group bacterium]|nr:RpiB/LacA/LacB family sugar-phosphate isomerase [Parcubacteria group bacterium]
MKIFFGADHAGFELKNTLLAYVRKIGYEAEDKGPFVFDENDDYPDFIAPVARAVAEDPENARGIIMGGGGQGEAITANRFAGVRAAVFYGVRAPKGAVDVTGAMSGDPLEIVRLARTHNNTNVLSLAARFLSEDEA